MIGNFKLEEIKPVIQKQPKSVVNYIRCVSYRLLQHLQYGPGVKYYQMFEAPAHHKRKVIIFQKVKLVSETTITTVNYAIIGKYRTYIHC